MLAHRPNLSGLLYGVRRFPGHSQSQPLSKENEKAHFLREARSLAAPVLNQVKADGDGSAFCVALYAILYKD